MAMPPTQLHGFVSAPADTVVRLYRHGLIDGDGARLRQAVEALEAVAAQDPPEPGWVGPNTTDQMVQAIQPWLNEHGQRLAWLPQFGLSPEDEALVRRTKEEAWRERNGDEPYPGSSKGPTWRETATGCLTGLVGVAAHVTVFLGVLRWFPHPQPGRLALVGGSVLAVLVSAVTSLVGESFTEDVVKFVLIGGGSLAAARGADAPVAALFVGIAVGAFMPIVGRLALKWTRPKG